MIQSTAIAVGLFAAVGPVSLEGAESSRVYDLAACVIRASEVYPEVMAAQAQLEGARAQKSQADAARFLPSFDLTFLMGPSPEARGNALAGDSDIGSLSLFTRTEARLIQPLYTFGKLGAARDAAASGVDARQAGVDGALADLEQKVALAYYGVLLMDELWSLAMEANQEVDRAHDTVEEKLDEDTGDYTYSDLYRIERFQYDVQENVNKVRKERALVRAALRMFLNLPASDELVLADRGLRQVDVTVGSLEDYVGQIGNRSDLRQLEAGIRASEAKVRVERSDFYPQLFLGGGLTFAHAPNRDDQKSPFASDSFNTFYAGGVVGFKQSLAFGQTSAKVKKARMDHRRLTYLGRVARSGAALDVRRRYLSLQEAGANVEAATKAVRSTKLWFLSARDGFNAGLEEAGELIDAVKEYGVIRAKYYRDVFTYNTTWATLMKTTGAQLVPR
jgi:outer membrane protein TolC